MMFPKLISGASYILHLTSDIFLALEGKDDNLYITKKKWAK